MRNARIHPRILGYLGRALSLEQSAVQQYMTQASLTEAWGYTEAATRLRRETVEEMQHAERIIARMLELGVAPNASQLRPAALSRNLVDLLRQDAELESEIVQLYEEAVHFCRRTRDEDNARFFEALLAEERDHEREIAQWLQSLGAGGTSGRSDRVYF